jgi:2,4-dienoyl-CoA reductase-like NADH-dependent reductase (Old Yellow Enzyme family)
LLCSFFKKRFMFWAGNIQVSQRNRGLPWDVYVPERRGNEDFDAETVDAWRDWQASCKTHSSSSSTPTLVQLVHTGRQSLRGNGRSLWEPSISPSAVRLDVGRSPLARLLGAALFNTPREMVAPSDFDKVVDEFRHAALLTLRAGFDGVQIHCAHGYLLAQTLSPRTNRRTDAYGTDNPLRGLKLVLDIVRAIRADVPSSFCLAVKLNSADYVQGGLSEDVALEHVRILAEHGGIDMIEVSGGTYENVGKYISSGGGGEFD